MNELQYAANTEFIEVVSRKFRRYAQSTQDNYMVILLAFAKAISPKLLVEVKPRDVMEYITALDYADRTVRKIYYGLRSMYNTAVRYELLLTNPVLAAEDSIPSRQLEDVRPTKYIPEARMEEILSAPKKSRASLRDQVIILLLAGTGLRRSEITRLQIQDIVPTRS